MKRVLHQSLHLAISASILLAFTAPLTAHAAEEINYYDSYISKTSGVQLYSAGQLTETSLSMPSLPDNRTEPTPNGRSLFIISGIMAVMT